MNFGARDGYPLGDIKCAQGNGDNMGAIREVRHGRDDRLPPPMRPAIPMTDLPWMRRERADGNLRRALHEVKALIVEDSCWTRQYETLVYGLEAAVSLLDLIEDVEAQAPSLPSGDGKLVL